MAHIQIVTGILLISAQQTIVKQYFMHIKLGPGKLHVDWVFSP